jgi:hypothetical protein
MAAIVAMDWLRSHTAHALPIGIGTYAHAPQLNVPITAADAQAVANDGL